MDVLEAWGNRKKTFVLTNNQTFRIMCALDDTLKDLSVGKEELLKAASSVKAPNLVENLKELAAIQEERIHEINEIKQILNEC